MPRPGLGGGRPAVARPIIRYPADAESVRGREKWLGGRSDVRRAVVPEDGEPAVFVVRARIVRVQRATVAQLQIGFRHAQPPVPGTDREDPHPLSVRLRDTDATGAQIVYGLPHPLPRITRDTSCDELSAQGCRPSTTARLGQPGREEPAFGLVVGKVERGAVGVGDLVVAAEASQQVGLGRLQVPLTGEAAVSLQGLDLAQRDLRPPHLGHGDGPVERYHR